MARDAGVKKVYLLCRAAGSISNVYGMICRRARMIAHNRTEAEVWSNSADRFDYQDLGDLIERFAKVTPVSNILIPHA